MKKLLLNHFEAYQLMIGENNLSEKGIKVKLTYLRSIGLKSKRIGRDFYYQEKHLQEFIDQVNPTLEVIK